MGNGKSLYADIAERFENGGSHVFLMKENGGELSFYEAVQPPDGKEAVFRRDDFEGMFWDPDAQNGAGAFGATWIADGERHWIYTSGSLNRDVAQLEAKLRLGGILAEEHGVEALCDPKWLELEDQLSRIATRQREGNMENTQRHLAEENRSVEGALLEWVQSKNALEGPQAWPSKLPEVSREIDSTTDHIQSAICGLHQDLPEYAGEQSADLREAIRGRSLHIHEDSARLGTAVQAGTEDLIEHTRHGKIFDAWQNVAGAVERFAKAGEQSIRQLQSAYPGVADYDLGYAAGSLSTAAEVARQERIRGIRVSLNGPLAEYALEDARRLGILREPQEKETGVLRGRLPDVSVLEHDDGTLVACPVPPGKYNEISKRLTLHDQGEGIYGHRVPERSRAEPSRAQPSRTQSLPHPDQEKIMSPVPGPDVVTRWTGKVLGREADGSALYLQAAGKVTKLTMSEPVMSFPEVVPGSYGVVRAVPGGMRFEERDLSKGKGFQRG